MISPRWRKVLRELWSNRTRTLLVVVSIAVGVFAVGTVQQLRTVLLGEMQAIYDASSAAQATIYVDGVDEAMLDTIRRTPGVGEVEGRSTLGVNVQVGPDQWESISLTAVEDFEDIRINRLEPVYTVDGDKDFGAAATEWPERDEVILERGSLQASDVLPDDVAVGKELLLETVDGKRRPVIVSGLVYDPNGFPAAFTGTASGYVTVDTLERLGGTRTYSQVMLRVEGTPEQQQDKEYINQVATAVANKIEKSGRTIQRIEVPEPGKLRMQTLFDSLALLLTPLGLLALLLSGFLVVNTISALMAQQVRQIGVMKAIGARRYQIATLYLGAVLVYSLVALVIAVPLTVVVAGGIAQFLGTFINVEFPALSMPTNVLLIQIGVGILVPLVAAMQPILKGTSVTVREAVSDFGAGEGRPSVDWTTQILSRMRGLSRPLQLSLRNTFRRKSRLILTLITLVMGGMIFMTVGSVRVSLDNLIEQGLAYNQFDVQVQFERTYRIAQIEQVARSVPGVTVIESWGKGQAIPVHADGTDGDPITITALPAESEMVQPTMIDGRWLLPEDENAIVISQDVLANEPELEVGNEVVLEIGGKEGVWVVVGIAQVLSGPPNSVPAYVNYPYFAQLTGSIGRAASVQIKANGQNVFTVDEMVTTLEGAFDHAGMRIGTVFTIERLRSITGGFFDIIVYLLLTMGTLIAAVGALGLMGTMSTNVLERTREIGVMRAIGASDGAVQRIVLVEGVLIGLISWLIGGMLAFPAGAALSTAVGKILFQTPLPYTFSINGVFTWLAIVAVLAGIASFLPAWNASRLTVREVLAYE